MSYDSKAAATAAANGVLKKLKTPRWEIRVWENLGWHFSLGNGLITLHEERGEYFVLMSDSPDGVPSGSSLWIDRRYYKDPNAAVSAQMKLATKVVDNLVALLAEQRERLRDRRTG